MGNVGMIVYLDGGVLAAARAAQRAGLLRAAAARLLLMIGITVGAHHRQSLRDRSMVLYLGRALGGILPAENCSQFPYR